MVKVNPDPQPGEGTIWFDYFLVTDPRIQSSSSTTKARHVGAIVGGVIGGILFLIVVALALFQIIRRRNKRRDQENIQPWTEKDVVQLDVPFRTLFSVLRFFFKKLKRPFSTSSSDC